MRFLFHYRRVILLIAAILNIGGALAVLISPAFFFSNFFKFPPDPTATFPYLSMYHYLMWSFILIMGIAYWMTAIDPEKNRIVLLIGTLGKAVAVTFWIMLLMQGWGKWGMVVGIAEDGPMAIIMAILYFGKSPETKQE